MIELFLILLFGTLIVVRIFASLLHDFEGYEKRDKNGKSKDKSKTVTGYLRKRTGFDWHHIHFGIIILIVVFLFIILKGLSKISVIFLGIGLSLVADQITPLIDRKSCYYSKRTLMISIILHILIAIIFILVLNYKLI